MAEIHLTGMLFSDGGPDIPAPLRAALIRLASSEKLRVLRLSVGTDAVVIWPADPVRIRELAADLIAVAKQLEEQT